MNFSWCCPFCNHNATIGTENYTSKDFVFNDNNKYGYQFLKIETITCPNPNCKEYTLRLSLYDGRINNINGRSESCSKPKKIRFRF